MERGAGVFRFAQHGAGDDFAIVMNYLDRILEQKRLEVQLLEPHAETLRCEALQRNDFRGFRCAIDRGAGLLGIVAEVKQASPSAGRIAQSFDPVAIAGAYERGGANAVSVLTDRLFFQGSLEDLRAVRKATALPILRKDFIISAVQIYEAGAAGADAVLLIVAALEGTLLHELLAVAESCQLDVLLEVHTMGEMDRALDSGANLIGINNRDLTTFATDLAVTERLAEQAGADVLLVSESGLKTAADLARVRDAGANAVLVGERLMRSADPESALRELQSYHMIEPAEPAAAGRGD